jgi:hypothetical protein
MKYKLHRVNITLKMIVLQLMELPIPSIFAINATMKVATLKITPDHSSPDHDLSDSGILRLIQ